MLVQKEPSREREVLEINQSSGTIVDQKKQKIFERVFELLLTDSQPTYIPLVHPATANYRRVPFGLLEIMVDVFTDFEADQKTWKKDQFLSKCHEAYNVRSNEYND